MNDPILVTGGLGLIGSGFATALRTVGTPVRIFDILGSREADEYGDVQDTEQLRARMAGCTGIVHLAGISRVIWGERDPVRCLAINVGGTKNVLKIAAEQPVTRRPWFIFASSREVYGEASYFPVREDSELSPINVYGRSKVAAESLTLEARDSGLVVAVARFSNVFGSTRDHPDRVVPAFARAAAIGSVMKVEGGANTFDFTWRDDVSRGLLTLCQLLADERARGPQPIHFVGGRETSLGELAGMACDAGGGLARVEMSPPRNFDVAHFRGDPGRASKLLGWRAVTSVESGVRQLVEAYKRDLMPRTAHRGINAPIDDGSAVVGRDISNP
jgi:UDP-glucose 4-epimerase